MLRDFETRQSSLDYLASLQYLYGLTDYEKERIARYDPDTLDLERVLRVLARLGNPQQGFRSIHIAGTKGKGSVAAMCASVLQNAGYCTGLYTSPHLHTFRERIQIDSQLMPQAALTALVQAHRPLFDQEPQLTTFEAITALAFAYFAQNNVDLAVIEVGLGGRLDATNVITPQVSVITSLSFDHTYLLGHTLADIAREKGGIIKPGRPTVCEPQAPEALAVIREICDERGSPLTLVGRDWTWQRKALAPDLSGQSFDVVHNTTPSPLDGHYATSLLGSHQISNAVAAIAALNVLQQNGVPLQPHHVRQGLAGARWPGRFEILRREPPLVLDCAHNGDSVAKLAATLSEAFGPDRLWTFILGVSKDKDVEAMLHALAPMTGRLLATQSRHQRAMHTHEIVALVEKIWQIAGFPWPEVVVTEDVGAALNLALAQGNAPVCVTGSIFVVADAREAWTLATGGDLPETDTGVAVGLSALAPQSIPSPVTAPIIFE